MEDFFFGLKILILHCVGFVIFVFSGILENVSRKIRILLFIFHIFAMFPRRSPVLQDGGVGMHIWNGVYLTLCSWRFGTCS